MELDNVVGKFILAIIHNGEDLKSVKVKESDKL